MLLRCPRCQALFSVQEGIAPAGVSFQVECGRCRVVFQTPGTAMATSDPPRPVEVAAPSPVQTPSPRVRPPAPRVTPPVLERKTTAEELARALRARRPERAVLEAQRQLDHRHRALVHGAILGGVVVAALLIVLLVRLAFFGGPPREVQQRLHEARELLFRDDERSLSRAAGLFAEAAVLAEGKWASHGDRATALFLLAASHRDLAFRLATSERDLEDAQVRVEEDQPEGWEKEAARLTETRAALRVERDGHLNEAARLLREGLVAAKASLDRDREDEAGLRAMALQSALVEAGEDGARFAERAARKQPRDPWIAYARATLLLAGRPGRERQEQASAVLAEVRRVEPRLLRASVDSAALALDRGDVATAREGFAQALRDNPQHERAQRLLALVPTAP